MKHLYTILTLLVLGFATQAKAQTDDYIIATLTFEDEDYKGTGEGQSTQAANWSSLIDEKQYGGTQLYGESGYGTTVLSYYWADDNNTNLGHQMLGGDWGYAFWNGAHAISNYGSSDLTKNGSYMQQLTVYVADANGDVRIGAGHNGSNNFAIHNGYSSGMGACPNLYFTDGEERVIDHMWVNTTTYFLNEIINGGACPKIGADDYVKIIATGYSKYGVAGDTKAEFYLANGAENIVKEWTKFDLSVLGPVALVEFDITGTLTNDYGFAAPAYFAYDDVAVRLTPSDSLYTAIARTDDAASASAVSAIYTLDGRRVDSMQPGVNIIRYANGTSKKVYVK